MENASEVQVLQERIKGLQEDLRLLRRDIEKFEKDPISILPPWRRVSLFILLMLIVLMSSEYLVDRFWNRNRPKRIDTTGIDFSDREGTAHFGSITDSGPSFKLRNSKNDASFDLSHRGLRMESKDSGLVSVEPDKLRLESKVLGSASIRPDELRLESKDGTIFLSPYRSGDTEGLIITTRSSTEPTQRASLVLALPDGKAHLKPRVLILDNSGKVVE